MPCMTSVVGNRKSSHQRLYLRLTFNEEGQELPADLFFTEKTGYSCMYEKHSVLIFLNSTVPPFHLPTPSKNCK